MRQMLFWKHGPSALVTAAVTALAVVLIAGCGSSSTSRNTQMLQSVGKSEGQLNLVLALPAASQQVRLNRLTPKIAERRRHQRNPDSVAVCRPVGWRSHQFFTESLY